MRRGIGIRRWREDELQTAALWVERTDRDEIQIALESEGGASVDEAFLTIEQARELVAFVEESIAQTWPSRR